MGNGLTLLEVGLRSLDLLAGVENREVDTSSLEREIELITSNNAVRRVYIHDVSLAESHAG